MYANYSRFGEHRQMGLWKVFYFSVVACVTMGGLVVLGNDGPTDTVVPLSVNDPRPVAKAIETLEAKYGWVITYEDLRYVHESDIADVTEKVRKDLNKFEPGKAPKVLIPKGGPLNLSYRVSQATGQPENPAVLIQKLLDAYAAGDPAGTFRWEQTGSIFHVVPAQVKNRAGQWVEQDSILDVAITLPEQERRGAETLAAICAAVSQATQTQVVVGTIPTNLFFQHRSRQGAVNETAREVLVRTLEGTDKKLSWQLFYDPGLQMYALNVYLVSNP